MYWTLKEIIVNISGDELHQQHRCFIQKVITFEQLVEKQSDDTKGLSTYKTTS